MARKPFGPRPEGTPWGIGMGMAAQRPELLTLIGECATIWPFVEHQMAMLLGVLLGSDTDASMAVFSSLRQFRAQRDAIMAAAEVTRSEADCELIEACLSVFRTAERARDDLMHGQWGISDAVPDGLLWIEAKRHAVWNTAAVIRGAAKVPHSALVDHFFVYTRGDLGAVRDELKAAWQLSFDLLIYIKNDPPAGQTQLDQEYDRLSAAPLVREALAHLRRRKSTR